MTQVDRIKQLCKEKKIPLYRLEKDLGFANAYISGLKKGYLPPDRLSAIAKYLHVSESYLSTGEETVGERVIRRRDENRDIVEKFINEWGWNVSTGEDGIVIGSHGLSYTIPNSDYINFVDDVYEYFDRRFLDLLETRTAITLRADEKQDVEKIRKVLEIYKQEALPDAAHDDHTGTEEERQESRNIMTDDNEWR